MIRLTRFLAILCLAVAATGVARPALASDAVNVAIGQRGFWDTMVTVQGNEQGFFKAEGLDLNLTFTAGGSETLQAVSTGSADIGIGVGTTGAIGAFSKGAALRIISGEFTGASDIFWYARADGPKSMADMNGKTMGYSRPGSSSYIGARLLAQAANVNPNFVSSGEVAGTRTQVMSGQLDCGWSVPPFNFDLINEKKIRIIARGSDVKDTRDQTIRVNIANTKFLSDRRDVARRFMQAYARTVEWMYSDQKASLARYARYNEITPELARQALSFYPKSAVATLSIAGFNKSLKDALEYKAISKPLASDQIRDVFDVVYTGK